MSTQEDEERVPILNSGPVNRPDDGADVERVRGSEDRALSNCVRLSYGVGHVLNDLTASMWFSYLLVFLHQVNEFENVLAGNLMFIGQVSDALFTPFIGYESDRTRGFCNLGSKKSWHLVGTICVICSIPFVFSSCITCEHAPDYAQFVYYAPFIVIFQFGWAAVQISHLSFSSELTPFENERCALQSIRTAFTVFANVTVFGTFYLLFKLEGGHASKDLGPSDAPKFQHLVFICIGIGILFNVLFHAGTRQRNNTRSSSTTSGVSDNTIERSMIRQSKMQWKDWLKEYQFYQIALLYMSTRLFVNISQVYLPMYLTETLKMAKSSIALLPLVSYCSSFLMSVIASKLNGLVGRKAAFCVGVAIGTASCIWMYFLEAHSKMIYGTTAFLGAAGALLLITSLSMTNDLIGNNTESSAFVFGAMSFTDKLSNGITVVLIQKFHPCVGCCPACSPYYRHIQTMVPGGALIIGIIALLTLIPQKIGNVSKTGKLSTLKSPTVNGKLGSNEEPVRCICSQSNIVPGLCSFCRLNPPSQSEVISNYQSYSESESESDRNSIRNIPVNSTGNHKTTNNLNSESGSHQNSTCNITVNNTAKRNQTANNSNSVKT